MGLLTGQVFSTWLANNVFLRKVDTTLEDYDPGITKSP